MLLGRKMEAGSTRCVVPLAAVFANRGQKASAVIERLPTGEPKREINRPSRKHAQPDRAIPFDKDPVRPALLVVQNHGEQMKLQTCPHTVSRIFFQHTISLIGIIQQLASASGGGASYGRKALRISSTRRGTSENAPKYAR